MKQAMINSMKNGGNDELYTPSYAVLPILKHIPKSVKTIWCPFDTKESNIVKVLIEKGYQVIATHIEEGLDFFTTDIKCDLIISNPPYSIKDDIIERCYKLGYPFMLLLPITTLEGVFRGNMFRDCGLGVIVLDRRVEFMDKKSNYFNTSWFCSTFLGLKFEKLEKTKEVKTDIGLKRTGDLF